MILNEDKGGLFCISLVDEPAIESDFILLNKELVLALKDEAKKTILGAALIPNMPIYRKGGNGVEPYYAKFSEETILKCAKSFLNRSDRSISIMHNGEAIEASIIESFITDVDRTDIYAPKGSWVVRLSIEDTEVLNKVYDKMLNGFSIEGAFNKGEVNQFKTESMEQAQIDLINALIEKVQALLDAIAAATPAAEKEESVTEEMKKQIEDLTSTVEKLTAEKAELEANQAQSILKMETEGRAVGFREFINKLNK